MFTRSFFIILFSVNTVIFSQELTSVNQTSPFSGNYLNDISNNRITIDGANNSVDLANVKGSPYENSIFVPGKATNELTNTSKIFYLRYNIYNDAIQMKENLSDENGVDLIKSVHIYAVINNKEYHFKDFYDEKKNKKQGYFILISKEANSRLYLRKTQKFVDKEVTKDPYGSGAPAAFLDYQNYYFEVEGLLVPIPKKRKDFSKQFSENEAELNKFMKKEKINLKLESDLIKLFKYYNSLK